MMTDMRVLITNDKLDARGGTESFVRELATIYQQVIERQKNSKPDPHVEILAASRYLRRIVPLIKLVDDMNGEHPAPPSRPGSFKKNGSQSLKS